VKKENMNASGSEKRLSVKKNTAMFLRCYEEWQQR
jgi:hypothetical protein